MTLDPLAQPPPLSSLHVICSIVGEEPGPEVVRAVGLLPDQEVRALVDEVAAHPPMTRRNASPDELVPLVSVGMRVFNPGHGREVRQSAAIGVNVFDATDPRKQGTGEFSSGVVRSLLWCHGLTIEDPISVAADMVRSTGTEFWPAARLQVEASIASSCEISPLIDAGIIDTYFLGEDPDLRAAFAEQLGQAVDAHPDANGLIFEAYEEVMLPTLSEELRELWVRIRSGDRSPPLELVERAIERVGAAPVRVFIDAVRDISITGMARGLVDVVAGQLADIRRTGGHNDLLLPGVDLVELLNPPAARSDPLAGLLGRVTVPAIEGLLVNDLISIRKDSAALDRWRRDLRAALIAADTIERGTGDLTGAASVLVGTMQESLDDFEREQRQFRAADRRRRAVHLGIGAAGGAVAGAPSGSAGALVGAVGNGLAAALLAATSSSQSPSYLHRHYLTFDDRTVS